MAQVSDIEIVTERVTVPVSDGTTLPLYVARPASGDAKLGILVLQEAFGVNSHIRDVTERFAREGYIAVAPVLFHRTDPDFEGSYTDFPAVMPHMQALTDEGQAADLKAAYEWLISSDGKASAVGAIGFCMGGRSAFLANATLPLHAAASFYGGGIGPNDRRPDLMARVPDIQAPMLLVWGGKDTHIPPTQTRAVEDALIAAGKTYEMITFSQADHGFFCDVRASYEPDASRQAWALTLAFFVSYLHI